MAYIYCFEKAITTLKVKLMALDTTWTDGARTVIWQVAVAGSVENPQDADGYILKEMSSLGQGIESGGDCALIDLTPGTRYYIKAIIMTDDTLEILSTVYGTATTYPGYPIIKVYNIASDSATIELSSSGNVDKYKLEVTSADGTTAYNGITSLPTVNVSGLSQSTLYKLASYGIVVLDGYGDYYTDTYTATTSFTTLSDATGSTVLSPDIYIYASEKHSTSIIFCLKNLGTDWVGGRCTVYWYMAEKGNHNSYLDVPDNAWIYYDYSYIYYDSNATTQGKCSISPLTPSTTYIVRACIVPDNSSLSVINSYSVASTTVAGDEVWISAGSNGNNAVNLRLYRAETVLAIGNYTVCWYMAKKGNYASYTEIPDADWIHCGSANLEVEMVGTLLLSNCSVLYVGSLTKGTAYVIKATIIDTSSFVVATYYDEYTTGTAPQIYGYNEFFGYTANSCGWVTDTSLQKGGYCAFAGVIDNVGEYAQYRIDVLKKDGTLYQQLEMEDITSDYMIFYISDLFECSSYRIQMYLFYEGSETADGIISYDFTTQGRAPSIPLTVNYTPEGIRIRLNKMHMDSAYWVQNAYSGAYSYQITLHLYFNSEEYGAVAFIPIEDVITYDIESSAHYIYPDCIQPIYGAGTYRIALEFLSIKDGYYYQPIRYGSDGVYWSAQHVVVTPPRPVLSCVKSSDGEITVSWVLEESSVPIDIIYITLYESDGETVVERMSAITNFGNVTFTGLVTGNYIVKSITESNDMQCVDEDGNSYTAMLNVILIGERPQKWEWEQLYELSSGGLGTVRETAYIPVDTKGFHPVTADEWNRFITRVNEIRAWARENGVTVSGGDLVPVGINDDFRLGYNLAVEAIKSINGAGGYLTQILSGDGLNSRLLMRIADEINAVLDI